MSNDSGRVQIWQLDELQAEILDALATGAAGDGRVVGGRALAVKASPFKDNSSKLVVGTAALPPNFSTEPHSHEAEEVAVIISGTGFMEVGDVRFPVTRGAVVLVPSYALHRTHSGEGSEPLIELWFYAPPGSERRWMSAELTRDK
jgi:mannose-6-phosphate isomerase-like protein (cupin superfamily)